MTRRKPFPHRMNPLREIRRWTQLVGRTPRENNPSTMHQMHTYKIQKLAFFKKNMKIEKAFFLEAFAQSKGSACEVA